MYEKNIEHLEHPLPWQETAPIRLVLKKPDLFTPRKAEILQYNHRELIEPTECRPQNTTTLIATLIKHGVVEVK